MTVLGRYRRLLAGPFALIALAIVAGSIFFMAGPRAQGQSNLVSTNPADIRAGELLYQASCQSCHGFQGKDGLRTAERLLIAKREFNLRKMLQGEGFSTGKLSIQFYHLADRSILELDRACGSDCLSVLVDQP